MSKLATRVASIGFQFAWATSRGRIDLIYKAINHEVSQGLDGRAV